MEEILKRTLWRQFGASIDMLENAITACPEKVWGDRSARPEFWYVAYHTLFFLDFYLSDSGAGFRPPSPFTLDELDERGLLPDRVYTRDELLAYLRHGREKCRRTIRNLTDDKLEARCGFEWLDLTVMEIHFYNMRHIQHHAGQLNLLLRERIDAAPRWVRKTEIPLDGRPANKGGELS